jgi:L-amino acid N-acyltransferase YncA
VKRNRPDISVDMAKEGDLPAILALTNAAAERSTANFATEPETLFEWTESWRKTATAYPWLVARTGDGGVAGFAKASPHRARGAYRWTAEVSVYVAPKQHGAGIGTILYRHLVPVLRAQGYVTLLAGITPPNPPSERLHALVGFVRCGTYHRAGWKFGAWQDVGYWELHLVPEHAPPRDVRPVALVWPTVRDLRAGERPFIRREPLDASSSRSLIGALNAELSATYPEPGATHFRLESSEVDGDHGGFFVVGLGDEIMGCGALRALDADSAEIKRMFVAPQWRGLGLAQALLAALEDECARIGRTRICLETGERQASALRLYEGAGYRRIPPFGEYMGSPLSVCMEKHLAIHGEDPGGRSLEE